MEFNNVKIVLADKKVNDSLSRILSKKERTIYFISKDNKHFLYDMGRCTDIYDTVVLYNIFDIYMEKYNVLPTMYNELNIINNVKNIKDKDVVIYTTKPKIFSLLIDMFGSLYKTNNLKITVMSSSMTKEII